jgi:hypothetical protein
MANSSSTIPAPSALPAQRVGFLQRLHGPERPVLVFDGATGTSLQQMNLSADDFGGAALEGCNEILVLTRPDAVQAVHRQFLEVGADVIETDTFGATSLVLAEYDIADQALRSTSGRSSWPARWPTLTAPLRSRGSWRVPWAPPPSCQPWATSTSTP